jgi:hypothetical protein
MPNPPYNFIIQLNSDSYIKIRGDTSERSGMQVFSAEARLETCRHSRLHDGNDVEGFLINRFVVLKSPPIPSVPLATPESRN